MPNDPHPAFPDLHAFWDAYKELDAAYALLAKSCGLSEPEYWSLMLIRDGVETSGRSASGSASTARP